MKLMRNILFVGIHPGSENGGADAYGSGAFVNRNGPVAAHSHTYSIERRQLRITYVKFVEATTDCPEVSADASLVVGVGSHAHNTAQTHIGITEPGFRGHESFEFCRKESEFSLFGSYMQLKQYISHNSARCRLFIDEGEQFF